MKEHHRYVVEELKKKQQNKKDNGPIELTPDQLWKYSGETEPYSWELIAEKVNERPTTYKRLKFIYPRQAKIIWYHLKNVNKTTEEIAEKLNVSVCSVKSSLSEYYKIRA